MGSIIFQWAEEEVKIDRWQGKFETNRKREGKELIECLVWFQLATKNERELVKQSLKRVCGFETIYRRGWNAERQTMARTLKNNEELFEVVDLGFIDMLFGFS